MRAWTAHFRLQSNTTATEYMDNFNNLNRQIIELPRIECELGSVANCCDNIPVSNVICERVRAHTHARK